MNPFLWFVVILAAWAVLSAWADAWGARSSGRHVHDWQETGRTFTGTRPVEASWVTAADLERLAMGVTVIALRCSECGDVTSRELLGDARPVNVKRTPRPWA